MAEHSGYVSSKLARPRPFADRCLVETRGEAFPKAGKGHHGEFLRTARSVWLEIKSDNVEEMRRKILESGLVRKLNVPDPQLYFQALGGQCLRLVGIDEDMSFYEGAGAGPDVAKVKEALKKEAITK